jgi:beta-glucanase (GH16 family)
VQPTVSVGGETMNRWTGALALGLVLSVLAVDPVQAASVSRVTLQAPVVNADGAVTLRGGVKGHARTVRLQVRRASGWTTVKTARLRKGRYAVGVRAGTGNTYFRAISAGRTSAVRAAYVPKSRAPKGPAGPAPDACGPRPAKPGGGYWSCTFHDDFTGSELDRSRWTPATRYITGTSNAFACAIDDPSVISVSDGALNLTLRKVADPVPCDIVTPGATTNYVAGTVSTLGHFDQKYGRFEARMRSTATSYPGLHEAFWLWPVYDPNSQQAWPDSGEIDVAETYSIYPDVAIPYLHSSADSQGAKVGVTTAYDCTAYRGQWNTYTLVWEPSRIEILVNGKTCLVNTEADPAFQKAYIPILTQAIGHYGNEFDGRAPLPATVQVDYMRVWQ